MRLFTKIFLTFSILSLSSLTQLKAQNFEGYLVGGATTSQIEGDDLSGFTKWGFFAGPSVSYPFGENFHIGMQMLWVQKGSKRDKNESQAIVGDWETLHLDYIEVPFFAEYRFDDKWRANGGLGVGYLVNASENQLDANIADSFKRFEPTFFLGGSYRFTDRMHLYTRISSSILTISEGVNESFFEQRNAGLYNISLSIGIQYDLNME